MGFSSFSGLIVRPGIDRCNMTDGRRMRGWYRPPRLISRPLLRTYIL